MQTAPQRMTYTQRMQSEYRAMIILARCWRISYAQARAQGLGRTIACRVANAAVFMG